MKYVLRTLVLATLAATAVQTAQAEVRPVLGALLTGGGETLASGSYYNDFGDTTGSWKIRSGSLIHLFAGAEYREADSPIAVQLTLGYHIDDTTATDGSVSFSRYPAEALILWQPQDLFRAGVGFRKALGAKLSSSGTASDIGNFNFKSQLGMVVQGEYLVSQNFSLILRWVGERYEVNGVEIDGNHVGAGLSVRF
jgi:hypothetical protein